MDFLEEEVLPELITQKDLGKLESGIVKLRKTFGENFGYEHDFKSVEMPESEIENIVKIVKEQSGYEYYLENRERLFRENGIEDKLTDDSQIKIFFDEPLIKHVEAGEDETKYHLNIKLGKPEIILEKTTEHEIIAMYGHEYTHHTQAVSALDVLSLVRNPDENEMEKNHGIFRALREGQALSMEQSIAKIYAEKNQDPNYYLHILVNCLSSMSKVYNLINSSDNKNEFAFKKRDEPLRDGEIGLTYFMLNDLKPKDYYKEFIERFVNRNSLGE